MKSTSALTKALTIALGCGLAASAHANPTGAEVVAGQVSMTGSANQLLITNSPGAIINWQNFSILPGELTRFIQQNASSSVLNRITGQDPSKILGALQSNGKVVLINPNGILFGAGARVDVNGLIASTLNLSNADFLAGKLKFSGGGAAGEVSNQGAITTPGGGQVYLIGSSVTNGGVITSPGGDVVLAAGQSVDLADSNDPDVRVVISASGNQAVNVGNVVAETGRVGIYGALVSQMGLVSANSAVVGANGKIVLKSSGDAILGAGSVTSATGAGSGGAIEVTGNRVGLIGDAVVDASGQTSGGTVLIGGDEHGSNAAIQNAALAYVGSAAQIKADALQAGNGGKVVVWSDQQTQMYGNISARGAEQGGNGGFVETSSKGHLDFRGVVDLRAPSGLAGMLLLDPSDITIQAGGTSSDVTIPSAEPFDISAVNAVSTLSTDALQNALVLGNVTVTTSSSASAPSGGTITVASPLSWMSSNGLALVADNGIALNAPITAVNGKLSLMAANGNITQAGGPITAAAVAAVAKNGSVQLNDAANAIAVIAGSANGVLGFSLTNSGSFTVGTVPAIGQAPAVSGISSTNALMVGVVLQAPGAGDITIAAPIEATDSGVMIAAQGAVVQGAGGLISADSLVVNAGSAGGVGSSSAPLQTAVRVLKAANSPGAVYIRNAGELTVNLIDALGAVNVSTSGSLIVPFSAVCDCTTRITGSSVLLAAAGPMLVGTGSLIEAATSVALYSGYELATGTYQSAGTLAVDGDISAATIGLFAGGAITTSGTLTGAVTQTPSLYSVPAGPVLPPTLSECIATPTLPGCSAVLPTLIACTANPTAAGCSVVLPTLIACTTSPAAAGCSVVLPTVATCTVSPAIAGCSAVLPRLTACTANPAIAGCSVVLPTLATCTVSPTTAGCIAVLPTLTACTANPAAAGCGVVLPTLVTCTISPATSGCIAVLPTLATCTSNPTTAGCSVVLPPLASCTASPTLAGCSVVLPPTQISNTSVVLQANSTVLAILSTPSTAPSLQKTASSATGAPAGDSSSGSSAKSDASGKKADPKEAAPISEKSGVKNEPPPPKTFCN